MDQRKPIPESVWKLVQSLKDHEAVRRTAEVIRQDGHELQFSIEHDANGYVLISFYQDDCWMLQRPDGSWTECFVGQRGDAYTENIRKSGRTYVLDAYSDGLGPVEVFT